MKISSRIRYFIFFLVVLVGAVLLSRLKGSHTEKALAIMHATVIDATGAPSQPDLTVVVRGGWIVVMGPSGDVEIPPGARVVDARGKFLIPGLWDMHVHLTGASEPSGSREFLLPLLVANGITGVRDMGAYLDAIRERRREIERGTLLGPQIVFCGPYLDGPQPAFQPSIAIANEGQARNAVQFLKQQGVDFVKVQSLLGRQAYFTIADEAKKQRLPFAGHVPDAISAVEASEAGQKSVEHLTGILEACSVREAELRAAMLRPAPPTESRAQALARIRAWQRALLDSYSGEKAADLFRRFAKNGTWQVPTLMILRNFGLLTPDLKLLEDPRVEFLPPNVKRGWEEGRRQRLSDRTEADFALRKDIMHKSLELVGAMEKAGVPIMAGTDTPAPYVFPGSSLHEELQLLVASGLSPLQALQAATLRPAQYLSLQKRLGTIELGKQADMVLLDADPLADIRNTQKIHGVVLRGRLLDRKELNSILARVRAGAGGH